MNNTELQTEIHSWHLRNYPKDDAVSALLSVLAELGELYRAQLKQDSGIRGTWQHWEAEKQKEAGDVMIGLLNYAAFQNVSYSDFGTKSVKYSFKHVPRILLLDLATDLGRIITFFTENEVNNLAEMFFDLCAYCIACGWQPQQILEERWATISKRDFIANPETGGREAEFNGSEI